MRLVAILLCVTVSAYFLLHALYAILSPDHYLATIFHFIRYLAIPILASMIFIVIAIVATTKTRLLISLYSLSLLSALYLVEVFLTYQFYFQRPGGPAEQVAARDVDLGFTPKRLNQHLQTAEPRDAVLGHVPFTTIELCAVDYGPSHIPTDRFGLNNPDELFDGPVPVAVTGDSFVHGHCQPPGLDFVSLTRRAVPGTANMGLTGTGPLVQLAVVGRHVAAIEPAHVIACFFEGNDLTDMESELEIPWLAPGLSTDADFGPSPGLPERLAMVEELNRRHRDGDSLDPQLLGSLRRDLGWHDLLTNRTALRNFLALNLTTGMLGLSYGRAPGFLAEYKAVLGRMQEIVERWDGRLHLCYLPTRQRLGVFTSHYAQDQTRFRVLQVAGELELPVFDVTPAFAAHPRPRSLYASDGHFSIDGAALVAGLLVDYLTDHLPAD